jgi:hypothetical protein
MGRQEKENHEHDQAMVPVMSPDLEIRPELIYEMFRGKLCRTLV